MLVYILYFFSYLFLLCASFKSKPNLKSIQIEKEVELSLFADDMLFHIENPKDTTKKKGEGVLTDGQVVRNLPGNAGDTGSIPNERTKIPHAQLLTPTCSGACVPQVESQCTRTRALQDTVKILLTTTRPDTAKYLL